MARLKCKDGDFALVIHDTPGCRQNIGKVVHVQGPVRVLIQSQMMGWRIKPLFPAPWGITQLNGNIGVERVRAAVQFFRIGVVIGYRNNARDDAALIGHAQAFVETCFFNAIHVWTHPELRPQH